MKWLSSTVNPAAVTAVLYWRLQFHNAVSKKHLTNKLFHKARGYVAYIHILCFEGNLRMITHSSSFGHIAHRFQHNWKIADVIQWSKVNAAICIAHRREHAFNALPLPASRCWSPLASPFSQLGNQRTLRDHGYGLVYHAICLFTPPVFARYSFQPAHRAGSDWVGLGAWFRAEVVYLSKDGHPPRH